MSEQQPVPEVVDDVDEERFVLRENGYVAELLYELDGERLILVHTEVPAQLGGRGIGGHLVTAGVARAREEGLTVAPWCPFARKWLTDHPDAVQGVRIDWSAPPVPR